MRPSVRFILRTLIAGIGLAAWRRLLHKEAPADSGIAEPSRERSSPQLTEPAALAPTHLADEVNARPAEPADAEVISSAPDVPKVEAASGIASAGAGVESETVTSAMDQPVSAVWNGHSHAAPDARQAPAGLSDLFRNGSAQWPAVTQPAAALNGTNGQALGHQLTPSRPLSTRRRPATSRAGRGEQVALGIVIVLCAAAGGALVSVKWQLPLAAIFAIGLLVTGVKRPWLFLVVVLLVRPLLDVLSKHPISLGVAHVNVTSGVGLLILLVVAAYTLSHVSIRIPPLTGLFAALIGFGALSIAIGYAHFGSSALSKGLSEVIRLIAVLAVYVLAANVADTPDRVRRLFLIVALSALIPSLAAIVQYASGKTPVEVGLAIPRAFSTFYGPNPLGEYCAVSALILISTPAEFLRRSVRLVSLLIVVTALVMTFSRAGWSMLLVGLIVVEYRRVSRRLLLLGIICAGLLIAFPSVRDRVLPGGTTAVTQQGVSGAGLLSANGTYGSLGWRLNNWAGLLKQTEKTPLTGFGLDTTQLANPLREFSPNDAATPGFEAHSAVIRAIVEGGIIGFALSVAFWVGLIRWPARAMKDRWELSQYSRVLWGIWVMTVVTGLSSDDPFEGTALMYAAFALTGALLACYQTRPTVTQPSDMTHASDWPLGPLAHTSESAPLVVA